MFFSLGKEKASGIRTNWLVVQVASRPISIEELHTAAPQKKQGQEHYFVSKSGGNIRTLMTTFSFKAPTHQADHHLSGIVSAISERQFILIDCSGKRISSEKRNGKWKVEALWPVTVVSIISSV